MPQTITIVRHAETNYNRAGRAQGHLDVTLSDQGVAQAQLVATKLKPETIDVIYTSDLSRAANTAKHINSHHQAVLKKTQLLREKYLGQIEGMYENDREELAKKKGYTGKFGQWDNGFVTSMGGESRESVNTRLKRFWHKTKKQHPSQHIVFVTHGGIISTLIYIITQPAEKAFYSYGNTSVTRLNKTANPWQYDIQYNNDITHLV